MKYPNYKNIKTAPNLSTWKCSSNYKLICNYIAGWWFGTMEFYDFPYWEFHHPK